MNDLQYRTETFIYEYVNLLSKQKENLIIFISAKDTPGTIINGALNKQLQDLGLTSDFTKLHWHGFCAVISRGVVVKEEANYDHNVECSGNIEGVEYYLFSGPFHSDNKAIITINSINYCINTRGLNFVVFDLNRGCVSDSVSFDTYLPNMPATRTISAQTVNLTNQIATLNNKIESLKKEVQKVSTFSNQMFWQLYKKRRESVIDAKKRFFGTFEDNDEMLHLIHRCLLKLLNAFDILCKQFATPYWIDYGALLGAYRHGKCIPWDDDIDVGMMREDAFNLANKLSNNQDYKIEIKSAFQDGYIRYIRFMTTDKDNPCFIDIFLHDYCESDSDKTWENHNQIRRETIALSHNIRDKVVGMPVEEAKGIIFGFLDKRVIEEQAQLNPSHCGGNILWATDNFTYWKKNIFSPNDLFPLKRITLDGVECSAPNNIELRLQNLYGDVFTLPNDMDRKHIKIDETQLQAIKKYLND